MKVIEIDCDKQVLIKSAAKTVWGLVKNDKRPDGRPAFVNERAVLSNLNTAFVKKGLIAGIKESPHKSWVNLQSVLDYMAEWIDIASKTNRRVFIKSKVSYKHRGKRTSGRDNAQLEPMEPVLEARPEDVPAEMLRPPIKQLEPDEHETVFVLSKGDTLSFVMEADDAEEAAQAALKVLGYTITAVRKEEA